MGSARWAGGPGSLQGWQCWLGLTAPHPWWLQPAHSTLHPAQRRAQESPTLTPAPSCPGALTGPPHGCRFFVLPASREQEGTESTSEEGQLPQVVEELKDLQVAPGTRLAKFQLKVKGKRERDGGQGAVSCQATVA